MRHRLNIRVLPVVGLFILILYELGLQSWSPFCLSNIKNCTKSLMESDGFICEPDDLWDERKILHRIQDELNRKYINSFPIFMSNWEPEFHCSHARRIGRMGDGGKWVCDLFRLQNRPDCLIYSVGSSGDFSFENEIKKYLPNCEIHTFDFQGYQCPKGICTYHQFWLGDGKNRSDSKTWPMVLKELGHENRLVDVLKIDIEGGEFQFFPTMFETPNISHPRQILVELHPPPVEPVKDFFKLLRANNYAIFYKDPNLMNRGELYEYAFLRLNSQFFK